MAFVYPSFLYALSAILIPILIHLFNLRRPKKVFFSNIDLLKEVEQQTSKKLKVKHWLILLSRIFFIIFLVLLFAQPYIPTENKTKIGEKPYFSIYLDNSLSMTLPYSGETTLFQKSIKELNNLIDLLPRNAKIQLLDNDFSSKSMIFFSKEQAKDYLTEVKISNLNRTYDEVNKKQIQNLISINSDDKNIVWLSDFQKKSTSLINDDLDTNINYYLVPLQGEKLGNLFIDSIALSTPFIRKNEIQTLDIWIRNSGNVEVNNTVVQLFLNENQISMQNVDVAPNTIIKKQLNFVSQQEGLNKLKIVLDENYVQYDNEFIFNLDVGSVVKILEISDLQLPSFEKIYLSESAFEYQFTTFSEIDYSILEHQDLIILNELSEYNNGLIEVLKKVSNAGGNIAIIPNSKKPSIFNEFNIYYNEVSDTAKVKMEMLKSENQFFEGVFLDYKSNVDMPYFTNLLKFNEKGDVLLSLNNGNSLLQKFMYGEGEIFAFSTPFNTEKSSIFKHSWVLPMSYKLAMNSSNANSKIFYKVDDELVSINYLTKSNESILKLKSKDVELIPNQRKLNGNTILNLPKNEMKADFYEVMDADSMIDVLAFNVSKEESILDYFSIDELNQLSSKINVLLQKGEINFSDTFQVQNFGLTLWKYCLIISLIFLALEIILIRVL